jgi:MFS family permease
MKANSWYHHKESGRLGWYVRWFGWTITFVLGPVIYVMLFPHYGYAISLLAALGCFALGLALELLVIGPRAWVHAALRGHRDKARNLRYASVGVVFAAIGVWGFIATHEVGMLFVIFFSGGCALYLFFQAKAAR